MHQTSCTSMQQAQARAQQGKMLFHSVALMHVCQRDTGSTLAPWCRWQCIWTHHPKYPRGTSQTRCHFAVRKCPEAPGLGGDKTGSAPSEKTLREHCLRANRIPARTMSSMLCHPCACTVRACSSIGIEARPSRKAARLRPRWA